MLVLLIAKTIRVMMDHWLIAWVGRKCGLTTRACLQLCICRVCVGSLLFSVARTLPFMETTRRMRGQMAEKVLGSPQPLFDQGGRIVNRLSKDQAQVDKLLRVIAQLITDILIGCRPGLGCHHHASHALVPLRTCTPISASSSHNCPTW
eukprot:TRINITY_DN15107_c0_g1_i1.p1 TRINITY_DN15107_c0_g1~~TRINITY_DN15107_c0_g1_i1.p1  ORF type:complete len:149 (-),score=0.43 TRINITY_DN15107_c0_g1_i1:89-535(-)